MDGGSSQARDSLRAYEVKACHERGVRGGRAVPAVRVEDPFGALPVVTPGQLLGRLRYLANADCALREYDLQTGTDVKVGSSSLCNASSWPVLSSDGQSIAARASDGQLILEHGDGSQLALGPKLPHVKAPGNFVTLPSFSSDGSHVAFCTYSRTAMRTVVADTRTGRTVSTIAGTCETAFTSRGIAYLRGTRLLLNGRTLLRLRGASPANVVDGIGPEGNPLAANQQGTLLALATRPLQGGKLGANVTIHILDLDGRERADYGARLPLTIGFQALAPSGRSAVLWWGDILQLAAFGSPQGSMTLRYHLDSHSGDGEREVYPSAYSPSGAYAVMPRRPFFGTREPRNALILSGDGLRPLYRVPIDAQVAVWLPPD
jgi:hypothetical protein